VSVCLLLLQSSQFSELVSLFGTLNIVVQLAVCLMFWCLSLCLPLCVSMCALSLSFSVLRESGDALRVSSRCQLRHLGQSFGLEAQGLGLESCVLLSISRLKVSRVSTNSLINCKLVPLVDLVLLRYYLGDDLGLEVPVS